MLNIRSTATAAAVWLTPVIVRAAEVAAEAEHGGHGEGEVNLLKMDYGTAIFTLIIFIGLVIVLGKFVWPQIVKGLDVREAKTSNPPSAPTPRPKRRSTTTRPSLPRLTPRRAS
jgi:hypothetical protein